MKLDKESRNRAVRIASAVVAGYKPEHDEVELLAQTVVDCAEVFKVHAPVIAAVKALIPAVGPEARDFAKIYDEQLRPAVRALHRYDAAWGGK